MEKSARHVFDLIHLALPTITCCLDNAALDFDFENFLSTKLNEASSFMEK